MRWRDISTIPTAEHEPFLVLRPGNDVADFVIEQVSIFEGRMYPDALNGNIDHSDAIEDAIYWQPCMWVPVMIDA